ncbi:peptide ABC transporter substrate-binding protein [Methanosarcina spelaei]|uniref:Peptide ABC transporter substrate-binding protein n=1 Tax=Methanosarcina spelaei TaxID=1036679 RepID=A0A2A2HQZ6_9EURY|nr:ABC transporter substrate-binding protein [Methanosarcina spelaei]PAV11931.1 peptide ABC transporter substrate-binding protein [Methanosarcina spelaei]
MEFNAQKTKISISAVAVILIVALLCAGCVDTGEASKEKVLRVVFNEGPDTGGSLDPANGWTGWYVHQAGIYETLFYYDADMNLMPKLASGYKQLNDTEWEIQLRKDVTFHDGTKMNADAVLFSLKRVLDPSNSRSSEYSFIKDVRKTGEYTIVIETNDVYAPLISSLVDPVMSIVSPSIVDADKQPDGTGPFKFVSFEPGASLEVEKNPNYWDGEAKVDRILIQYNKDSTARTMLIKSGDVDISRDPLQSEYSALKSNPDINVTSKETLRTYFLYINGGKAPFNDTRVRQALFYAINRQEIVDTALEGVSGIPAKGIFTSTMPWNANDQIESYDYNPEKALELFEEAGITKGTDGKLYYNGKPFTVEIQTYTKRAALQPSAEIIASQLEKIGITSKVTILESAALTENAVAGNYDLSLAAWSTAPTGDPDYFLSSHYLSTGNYASKWLRYSNPQVDKWILEARTETDEKKRAELYDKIQIQIQKDAVLLPVFYANEIYALSSNVTGFEMYPNEYTIITKDIGFA